MYKSRTLIESAVFFKNFFIKCALSFFLLASPAFADMDALHTLHQFLLHLFDKSPDQSKSSDQANTSKNSDATHSPTVPFELNNLLNEARAKASAFGSFSSIVKKTAPAVVDLYATQVTENRVTNPFMGDPFFDFFFGSLGDIPRKRISQSSGSGVIISSDGTLVTCAHVVRDASSIVARLTDGREFSAEILKIDPQQDIAILKLKDIEKAEIPYLSIGDSDSIEVGDVVLAMGNSFGLGQTVTSGIISALSRAFNGKLLIQTDAAVNPGNSGGALVNIQGELIGVPNAILSKTGASHGIGFAIPSILIKAILRGIKDGNSLAWFGVYAQTLTHDMVSALEDKSAHPLTKGAIINEIHPSSPAKAAGLQQSDIIVAINKKPVFQAEDIGFRELLSEAGKDAVFTVWRKGKTIDITFKPISPPEIPAAEETNLKGKRIFDGITVANLSPAVAMRYALDERRSGVVIVKTAQSQGPSFMSFDFAVGDMILFINDIKIKTVTDLKSALESLSAGQLRTLVIDRGGQQVALRIR
ncbi:MAG: trypsin-like peptidase domain-containing protein [Alphaproteobacteria bacterium]|nr:trypsin-like peptidase domain-containing protein [Alphaproteobacteria bacterium]